VAENCTICSTRSRRPVRTHLDASSYSWNILVPFGQWLVIGCDKWHSEFCNSVLQPSDHCERCLVYYIYNYERSIVIYSSGYCYSCYSHPVPVVKPYVFNIPLPEITVFLNSLVNESDK